MITMFGGSHGVPKIYNLGRNPNTANPRPNLAIKGPKTGVMLLIESYKCDLPQRNAPRDSMLQVYQVTPLTNSLRTPGQGLPPPSPGISPEA